MLLASVFTVSYVVQMYVASVFIWILHMFHTYVVSVLSGCCVCLQWLSSVFASISFSCTFQVFHLSFLDVSSVDRVLHMDARGKREVARAFSARAMFGRRGPPCGRARRRHGRAMSRRHRPMCGHENGQQPWMSRR
jgi:hypothetical protein